MRPYCLPVCEEVTKMARTETVPFNGIAGAVRWGRRVFIACGSSGLKVFELKEDKAELVAYLTDFPAFDIALRNGFLAVAAGKEGIVILDTESLRPMRVLLANFPVYSVSWSRERLVARTVSIKGNCSRVLC